MRDDMDRFQPSFFMLVPTMACQASCRYCFAKKHGEVMSPATLDTTLDFIERVAPPEGRLQIVFHGGEPLLAGAAFYEQALPRIRRRFGARLRLSVQSNLWALNGPEGERLLQLLYMYRVAVGTSLDGYREMCDSQRGEGYYEHTSDALEKLCRRGIEASVICTFGSENADKAARVFAEAKGSYAIHGAVPTLDGGDDSLCVSAEQMKRIHLDSYEAYRRDPAHARVSTIDAMAEACFKGESSLCTFRHCLGRFAAIAPDGGVYSCQRFNGCEGFCLGNVNDGLNEERILASAAYRRLKARQNGMASACGDCAHAACCKGGCLYNSFAGNAAKDPYCEAYRAVFDRLQRDMALEMAGELRHRLSGAAAQAPSATPLLAMVGDRPHPYDERRNRERFAAAVRAGREPGDVNAWLRRLSHEDLAVCGLNRMETLYLNLTYRCPLRCAHCSANTGFRQVEEMPAARFVSIVREATEIGFRKIEFTGGEVFCYPEFDALMGGLAELDRRGTEFMFRTSFGFAVPKERIETACRLFDTVMVSMDGDEEYHDRRRGEGVYQRTVANLREAIAVKGRRCRFGLWSVLPEGERRSREGRAVRGLANELGIRTVVFKPLLPIGRGCGAEQESFTDAPAGIPPHFSARTSCGLGRILTVEPNGDTYPCFAWCGENKRLGNLAHNTLESVLCGGDFFEYLLHGVDTNETCRRCELRYLCGGICRAFAEDKQNVDSGDFICSRRDYYSRLASLA